MKAANRGASVRARLLNRARANRIDFNLILTRYSLERLLYRLSVSPWADQFLLKGALLFDLWFDQPHRPTRDIDLLGFGSSAIDDLIEIFQQVCGQPSDDGMVFDQGSVQAARIRKEANYEGVRVTLVGTLDGARCSVQIDVGYGYAVTPAAERVQFPALLEDVAPPSLRAYPVYTVIAEKYEAIVSLGMANTRLKDYFDLWFLATYAQVDEAVLRQAIGARLPVAGPRCRRRRHSGCRMLLRGVRSNSSSGKLSLRKASSRRRAWRKWQGCCVVSWDCPTVGRQARVCCLGGGYGCTARPTARLRS